MIRLPTLFWLIIVATTGFAMFAIKYQVQGLADRLTRTVKQADDVERDIRVLDAEWAYLNRPDALAQMNQRFLSLVPIATKQLRTSVADIPMRPAPPPLPPPPPPVVTVAVTAPTPDAATIPAGNSTPPAVAPPDAPAQVRLDEPVSAVATESPNPVATTPHEKRIAAAPARPTAVKTASRQAPTHRAASLNELIAQITESR